MFWVKIGSYLGMHLCRVAQARGISGTLLANNLIQEGLDRLGDQHEEQQRPNQTSNICVASHTAAGSRK